MIPGMEGGEGQRESVPGERAEAMGEGAWEMTNEEI